MTPRLHFARPSWRWMLAVLFIPVVGGCGIDQAMPHPDCATGGSWVQVAQSVPTAELVPCFKAIPEGWEVDRVTIDQDGTLIRFDSDRAGDASALFHFTDACDHDGAVYAPSQIRGADRFDRVESVTPSFRAQRFFEFEGGCMWWEFDFDEGATAGLSVELGERLEANTRSSLNESLRKSFLDVEL